MKKLIYLFAVITIQHLTLNIQSSFAQAPFGTPDNIAAGNCLDFVSANDDNVTISDHNSLDLSSMFTLEAWVVVDVSPPSNSYVLSKQDIPTTNNEGYGLLIDFNRNVSVWNANASGFCQGTSITALTLGAWTHLAFTYDGTNQRIYINGQLDQTNPCTRNPNNNAVPLNIGRVPGGGNAWDGQIDEVRIWNTVRTQNQIRDNMCKQLQGSETGLVGYWNMNEGTGSSVSDLTSNGNDGTLN